jgi:hypothetical protein
MSALTLYKLKNRIKGISKEEIYQSVKIPDKITSTESMRLFEKLEACDNNNNINDSTSKFSAPVLVETVPASLTTSQLIEATLRTSMNSTDPNTRFIEFFPPPIPPPQFLQPDFRKYNINYEPPARQRPCVGWRRFPA